ncbi:hypothetical protein Gohar_019416 [Gossypium harknessii]|uniref:RNase H type-1 domain-containing protein n=1 Tax=Gossypium harknessii TaxID=34285 RepID=A0A7J9IE41_9ROSI|nr:hypothetical protein [Gossypium harknessii]
MDTRADPGMVFAVFCWLLWKNRNMFIFQQVATEIEIGQRLVELYKILKEIGWKDLKGAYESDYRVAIEMIKKNSVNTPSMTLIRKINEAKRHTQTVKFQHVPREGKIVADWLIRYCPCDDVELIIIEFLIFYSRRLLLEDKLSTYRVRIS